MKSTLDACPHQQSESATNEPSLVQDLAPAALHDKAAVRTRYLDMLDTCSPTESAKLADMSTFLQHGMI